MQASSSKYDRASAASVTASASNYSSMPDNDQGNQFVLVVVLPQNGLSTLSATRRIELARALRSLVARAAQVTSLTVGCESEGETKV